MGEEDKRTLTDDDIRAIAAALEHRLANRFYGSIGRGFWELVWRGVILAMVGLAVYGMIKSPH
jgi:hypothetical protein